MQTGRCCTRADHMGSSDYVCIVTASFWCLPEVYNAWSCLAVCRPAWNSLGRGGWETLADTRQLHNAATVPAAEGCCCACCGHSLCENSVAPSLDEPIRPSHLILSLAPAHFPAHVPRSVPQKAMRFLGCLLSLLLLAQFTCATLHFPVSWRTWFRLSGVSSQWPFRKSSLASKWPLK